jgi:hypothetical protein
MSFHSNHAHSAGPSQAKEHEFELIKHNHHPNFTDPTAISIKTDKKTLTLQPPTAQLIHIPLYYNEPLALMYHSANSTLQNDVSFASVSVDTGRATESKETSLLQFSKYIFFWNML